MPTVPTPLARVTRGLGHKSRPLLNENKHVPVHSECILWVRGGGIEDMCDILARREEEKSFNASRYVFPYADPTAVCQNLFVR